MNRKQKKSKRTAILTVRTVEDVKTAIDRAAARQKITRNELLESLISIGLEQLQTNNLELAK